MPEQTIPKDTFVLKESTGVRITSCETVVGQVTFNGLSTVSTYISKVSLLPVSKEYSPVAVTIMASSTTPFFRITTLSLVNGTPGFKLSSAHVVEILECTLPVMFHAHTHAPLGIHNEAEKKAASVLSVSDTCKKLGKQFTAVP